MEYFLYIWLIGWIALEIPNTIIYLLKIGGFTGSTLFKIVFSIYYIVTGIFLWPFRAWDNLK